MSPDTGRTVPRSLMSLLVVGVKVDQIGQFLAISCTGLVGLLNLEFLDL
jgi:hypothetical protein